MKFDFESRSLAPVRNILRECVEQRQPTKDTLASVVTQTCRIIFPGFVAVGIIPRELLDNDACLKEFVDAYCKEYSDTVGVRILKGDLLSKKTSSLG